MSYNITLPERMILECLSLKDQNLLEIETQTLLASTIISNILQSLVSKNLVITREKRYSLNRDLSLFMKEDLFNSDDLLVETGEIIDHCIEQKLKDKNSKSFQLKKVYMNEREEKIFQGLIYNVQSFLESLKINTNTNISEQKIIFWGEENYGKIINYTTTM